MNSFSCVITGHRPTRFKFKYNEKDKRCQRIKKCLQEQLIRLYNQGVRCFWVGGAMGADMWAAEILLRMKEQTMYQDVELCLALPFEGYDAGWDDWHRKRMGFIRKYAEKVLILCETPSSESYKKRNYYMEDGVLYQIMRDTKTTKFVFGIAWIDNVTAENDVQTWYGADPTLF